MKFRLEVAPSVIKEARRIYLYREKERSGSGDLFIAALVDRYALIKSRPYAFQIRKDPFRYVGLRRLKYRLVYKVERDLVSVVQVRHMSRRSSK
jgi:mRNA-degrading endonuclease RelE of RelBE toxin-antitoxin system